MGGEVEVEGDRWREEVEKTSQKGAERLDPHTVTAAGQTTTQWARDSIKTNFKPQSKQWEHHSCIFSHVNRVFKRVISPS